MRMLLLAAAVVVSLSTAAIAQRRAAASPNGHVVHSRRGPVILHRAVPPYRGVHVYQGRR